MGFEWRLLRTVYDDENFAKTVRNVLLLAALIAVGSEGMGLITTDIPPDPLGTTVMTVVYLSSAFAAHKRVSRVHLALVMILVAGATGWYHARLGRHDSDILLVNQGAIFLSIAAGQAMLPLSVIEFLGSFTIYLFALIATALFQSTAKFSDFAILGFYGTCALGIAGFGIVGRTRLQEAERKAKGELESLNLELESKVKEQVKKIGRAELLRRFLPPELTDSLMTGGSEPAIDHVRRNVAIVCAAPAGFLESLAQHDTRYVIEFVNAYVAAMSQVAFDHGGVVERVVGPRMTVIFGAMKDLPADEAMEQALRTASELQIEANRLLSEWEVQGFESARLRLAIGIAYGSAVVGTFGSERRVDYSALGGAMVRAVRLSSEAIPGEIRLDHAASQHIPHDYELAPSEPVEFTPGEPAPCFIALARTSHRNLPRLDSSLPPEQHSISLRQTMSPTMLRNEEVHRRAKRRESTPSLNLGEAFDGRYKLEALIGRGGMATVYRAHHVALGQLRAIKVIQPSRLDSTDAVEQFRREAEATARIHHPNVVRLHDFGRSLEGHYYLVLDFIDGESLAHCLDLQQKLSVPDAVRLGSEILHALDAAHSRRLVHQDLKPSNVLLTKSRSALVTDFGLVTFTGKQTDGASYGGTPAYMSPEQWMNQPLDGRSDLYAWGVMMYEMLSGEFPLFSESLHDFAVIAAYQEPVPLRDLVPGVPEGLSQLIHQCLEKKPESRPASAQAALFRLREFHDQEPSSPATADFHFTASKNDREDLQLAQPARRRAETTARGGTPELGEPAELEE